MIPTQPLEVDDFTLGVTDYYIDGNPRAAEVLDNLFLTSNKKPRTRYGAIVVNDQLPLGAFRVNKLAALSDNLYVFQDKRAYYDLAGVWTEVDAPGSNPFMPSGDSNSVIIDSEWQGHLFFTSDSFCSPQKLFVNDTGDRVVRNAGLPLIDTGFSITPPPGAGSNYLYAFVLSYEYKVGTVTYLDRSPVFYYPTTVTGGAITTGNGSSITLPTTYATPENWDSTSWKLEIYRTTDAGDTFYLAGEVAFGTAGFSDETEDADLEANATLYTTGGIASNDTPPKAKFVHIVNDYGYWAHTKEGSEIFSTTVYQSKAGDPDSVPALFFADTEQPITGLSSIYDRPLVFCTGYIYRIDNFYADDGSGGMFLRKIDDKAGCVSAQSITRTHLGIFWAGNTGFYWSDGFRVECISDHLNETYRSFVTTATRRKNIVGTFDPSDQRVTFTVSREDGTGECDMIYALDLRYPFLKSGDNPGGTFVTGSGGDYFKPTQGLFVGSYWYRGDTRGYVLKHGKEYFTDPKIDTTKPADEWEELTILHTYKSCFLDFGSKFYRKWVPRLLVSADNTTNLSLGIRSSNDNDRTQGTLKPIRYRNNITWGDVLPLWGDPTALWNAQGLIEEWRRFPAGGLRCNYKQIILENAQVEIVDSGLLGTATVNPGAKTATLGGSFNWLPGIVDYFISFSHDNYAREYKITSRTPTTIIYEDTAGSGPPSPGPWDWKIVGKPKGEVLLLNGYVIHWAMLSKSHTPFSSGSGS